MNADYFKEKLIELQNSSESKYKNISEILTKCTEYQKGNFIWKRL